MPAIAPSAASSETSTTAGSSYLTAPSATSTATTTETITSTPSLGTPPVQTTASFASTQGPVIAISAISAGLILVALLGSLYMCLRRRRHQARLRALDVGYKESKGQPSSKRFGTFGSISTTDSSIQGGVYVGEAKFTMETSLQQSSHRPYTSQPAYYPHEKQPSTVTMSTRALGHGQRWIPSDMPSSPISSTHLLQHPSALQQRGLGLAIREKSPLYTEPHAVPMGPVELPARKFSHTTSTSRENEDRAPTPPPKSPAKSMVQSRDTVAPRLGPKDSAKPSEINPRRPEPRSKPSPPAIQIPYSAPPARNPKDRSLLSPRPTGGCPPLISKYNPLIMPPPVPHKQRSASRSTARTQKPIAPAIEPPLPNHGLLSLLSSRPNNRTRLSTDYNIPSYYMAAPSITAVSPPLPAPPPITYEYAQSPIVSPETPRHDQLEPLKQKRRILSSSSNHTAFEEDGDDSEAPYVVSPLLGNEGMTSSPRPGWVGIIPQQQQMVCTPRTMAGGDMVIDVSVVY